MPRVGSRHFPYTPEGYAAAAKAKAAMTKGRKPPSKRKAKKK